jgi:16S rRNA (guanine966-N2)-methyltransferase
MRIVAGRLRGRRLAAPSGIAIRPTSDRTRESIFNILAARIDFVGARVIDLFAGTGALGLEALSRGASFALFVDESTEGRALVRTNVDALGLQGVTKIFRRDATDLGRPGTMQPFDLAFADPPYGKGHGEKAADCLRDGGWLKPDALLVLEERTASAPEMLAGYETVDRRAFADTTIGFFRPLAGK